MVVPQHHFVTGPLGTFASADEGQNVAPVEHLHDADSTVDISDELSAEWQGVEDAEPRLSTNSKAVLVLVKANVKYILLGGGRTLDHDSELFL